MNLMHVSTELHIVVVLKAYRSFGCLQTPLGPMPRSFSAEAPGSRALADDAVMLQPEQ